MPSGEEEDGGVWEFVGGVVAGFVHFSPPPPPSPPSPSRRLSRLLRTSKAVRDLEFEQSASWKESSSWKKFNSLLLLLAVSLKGRIMSLSIFPRNASDVSISLLVEDTGSSNV